MINLNNNFLIKLVFVLFIFFSCSKNEQDSFDYSWSKEMYEFYKNSQKPPKKFWEKYNTKFNALFKHIKKTEFYQFVNSRDENYIDKTIHSIKKSIDKKGFNLKLDELGDLQMKIMLIDELLDIYKQVTIFKHLNFESELKLVKVLKLSYGENYDYDESFKLINLGNNKIESYKKILKSGALSHFKSLRMFNKKMEQLSKKIVLSNPILKDLDIVFTSRAQYTKDHHNTATLFHTNEINTKSFTPGGAMKILSLGSNKIKTLIETKDGIVRDPEISFDGKSLVFSMRNNIDEDYSIYEYDLSRGAYKRLTNTKGVSDIDPLYLPNGEIVFTSTRNPKYCMCNVHIMGNLFKMKADGSDIIQIGNSSLFEGHSTLLDDGRILYDRWEYLDRNLVMLKVCGLSILMEPTMQSILETIPTLLEE
jgi:hypothetical protein